MGNDVIRWFSIIINKKRIVCKWNVYLLTVNSVMSKCVCVLKVGYAHFLSTEGWREGGVICSLPGNVWVSTHSSLSVGVYLHVWVCLCVCVCVSVCRRSSPTQLSWMSVLSCEDKGGLLDPGPLTLKEGIDGGPAWSRWTPSPAQTAPCWGRSHSLHLTHWALVPT